MPDQPTPTNTEKLKGLPVDIAEALRLCVRMDYINSNRVEWILEDALQTIEQLPDLIAELEALRVVVLTLSNQDTVRALTQSLEDVKAGRVIRLEDLDPTFASRSSSGEEPKPLADWQIEGCPAPCHSPAIFHRTGNVSAQVLNRCGHCGNSITRAGDIWVAISEGDAERLRRSNV